MAFRLIPFLLILGLSVAFILFLVFGKPFQGKVFERVKNCDTSAIPISLPPFQVDDAFLTMQGKSFVFSGDTSGYYTLFEYTSRDKIQILDRVNKNVFSPFILGGKVIGLKDVNGNEKFKLSQLSPYDELNDETIKSIFTFDNGYKVVFHSSESNSVYYFDLKTKKKTVLAEEVYELHSAIIATHNNKIILNYDDLLIQLDLANHTRAEIASVESMSSSTPFLYNDLLYFASNTYSQYSQIYVVDISTKSPKPQLLYASSHDLRLPKRQGGNLYFVEVVNSEYLLTRLNLKTQKKQSLTNKGVIYDYSFIGANKLIASYADLFTPKSMIKINTSEKRIINLTGEKIPLSITAKIAKKSYKRSPAYFFSPKRKNAIKGVILYFHPGLHSDVSPRWDDILMNICNNGYIVIAPNYPMSSGFGKKYYNSDLATTVKDIEEWRTYINTEFHDLPLFYMSSSSGNTIMQASLAGDHSGVNGSISLFGISSQSDKTYLPTLYVLGKNDPKVSFEQRIKHLKLQPDDKVSILSFDDEGHWVRNSKNMRILIERLVSFMCINK